MSSERTADIIEAVNKSGLAVVWRNQSGVAKVRGGRMHLAPKGSPDIVGYTRKGRFVAFEAKTGTGTTQKERAALQLEWRQKIQAAGGIAEQVVTPQEAVAALIREDWK